MIVAALYILAAVMMLLLFQTTKTKRFLAPYNTFGIVSVFYAMHYILVPLYLALPAGAEIERVKGIDETHDIAIYVEVILGYIAIWVGYKITRWKRPRTSVERHKKSLIVWLHVAFLIVGLAGVIYYGSFFGGIEEAIDKGPKVRLYDLRVDTGLGGFAKQFGRLLPVTLLLGVFIVFFSDQHRDIKPATFFITIPLALAGTLFYFIITASRGAVIAFILVVMLILYQRYRRTSLPWIVVSGVLGVFFLLYGRSLAINVGSDNVGGLTPLLRGLEPVQAVIHEFVPQYQSLLVANRWIIAGHPSSLYGLDILMDLQKILPTRLVGIDQKFPNTSVLNTQELLHTNKNLEIVPPGHLAYCVYNFGIIGLMIGSLLFGIMIKKVDSFFLKRSNSPLWVYLFPLVSVSLARWIYFGSPGNFYRSVFAVLILVVMLRLSESTVRYRAWRARETPR